MTEGWDLVAMLHLLFHTQGTPAVYAALPHPPLPVVPREEVMPLAQEAMCQATGIRKSICITKRISRLTL